MSEQLVGHDDGVAEDGVRRLRRSPDWWRSARGESVETLVFLLPTVAPTIGDEVDIDGVRYRVLNVQQRRDVPSVLDPRAQALALDLEQAGPSPHDPLLVRARVAIERHGASVERLSATREGSLRHVSIHAVAYWPGRMIDIYGSGETDHRALADLEESVRRFAR